MGSGSLHRQGRRAGIGLHSKGLKLFRKDCRTRISRCAAARKMRLTVKRAGIVAAARCALFALRGEARNRFGSIQSGASFRATNVEKKCQWEEFYVEG
jgi:hypothetical protein